MPLNLVSVDAGAIAEVALRASVERNVRMKKDMRSIL
jgi:hypothetical protein